jgi:hypothetical protein
MTKPRIPTPEQKAEVERLLREHGEQAREERKQDEQRRAKPVTPAAETERQP